MNVLMISTDQTILDPRSASAERMRRYGQVVHLAIFVIGAHGGWGRMGKFVQSYRAIVREARMSRLDVVTAQDPFFTGLIAWRAARVSGAGLHLQLHGDFYGSSYWSRSFYWRVKLVLGKFLLRRARAVRVVSERVRRSIELFVSKDRIAVAPIPFAPIRSAGARPPQAVDGEREINSRATTSDKTVLCVARLEPEKGVDVLLHAVARLQITDYKLQIVGDGSERKNLEQLARDLGIQDRVTFAGHQKNLHDYYASAAVCVIPSRTESWGRVALEAMGAGCPVVMTDVGLAGEVVQDGVSGIVVPREDPDALAGAIRRVLGDESLRAKLISGGYVALQKIDPPEVSLQNIVASWQRASRARPIIMITQRADPADPNVGFVADWIQALQKHAPVRVIEYRAPRGPIGPIGLIRLLLRLVPHSRGVFAHMCPEYAIVAAPIAHFFGKPVLLWYTHKSVTWQLKVAAWLVDKIFTASHKSCRIRNKNVEVVGHGIAVNIQYPISNIKLSVEESLRLLAAGRVSPVKDFETPIRALAELRDRGVVATLTIAGGPYLETDKMYGQRLRALAYSLQVAPLIQFEGAKRYDRMGAIYADHDVLIHTSRTGSMDKVVLEALAHGVPVVSSSEAFADLLPVAAQFHPGAVDELVKILHTKEVFSLDWEPIFERVRQEHNLERLALRIANFFGV